MGPGPLAVAGNQKADEFAKATASRSAPREEVPTSIAGRAASPT